MAADELGALGRISNGNQLMRRRGSGHSDARASSARSRSTTSSKLRLIRARLLPLARLGRPIARSRNAH